LYPISQHRPPASGRLVRFNIKLQRQRHGMSPVLHSALVALHVLSAIVWVGGMFFAHFCLRPAAAETLEPPKRLPLMEATLRRFFAYVAAAVAVLLSTGFLLLAQVGFKAAPMGWHVMFGLGIVMALVFVYIWRVQFARFRAHCAASAWPAAGQVLNGIRLLVSVNLVLGVCTVVAAVTAR